MIRSIAILFYTGVLLHPLKPPKSRRERRGTDQTAVTGPGETYGESEPRVYIRDVQHTEKRQNQVHLSLPALSRAKRAGSVNARCADDALCASPDLRCVVFPDTPEHYCNTWSTGAKAAIVATAVAPAFMAFVMIPRYCSSFTDLLSAQVLLPGGRRESDSSQPESNDSGADITHPDSSASLEQNEGL